jgi:hypothetical protein
MTGKNASLKLDVGRALKEHSNGASVVKKGAVRADFSLSVIF